MPTPPITLGELTNVPAAGSPINSAWAQDITKMVVHRFASVAARDAFGTWPNGRLAFTTDTQTLWLKETGGWVIVSEPPQIGVTNNLWLNGVTAWANPTSPSTPVIGTVSTHFQRAMGLVFVVTDMAMSGPGPWIPELTLPFAQADSLEGKLQVAVLQPGVTYFPAWSAATGTAKVQPQIFKIDGTSGCLVRSAISSTVPFLWSAGTPTGGSISVSGWYQMATRYS